MNYDYWMTGLFGLFGLGIAAMSDDYWLSAAEIAEMLVEAALIAGGTLK